MVFNPAVADVNEIDTWDHYSFLGTSPAVQWRTVVPAVVGKIGRILRLQLFTSGQGVVVVVASNSSPYLMNMQPSRVGNIDLWLQDAPIVGLAVNTLINWHNGSASGIYRFNVWYDYVDG